MSIYTSNNIFQELDLSLLRHFFAIASFGGFSKASRATGVSQPALSLGLKKLEKSLGTTLVERNANRFTLTTEGLALFTFCQRFEASLGATLRSFGLKSHRRLRIGAALSIGSGPFIELCENNAKSRDPAELELLTQNTFQLLNELAEGSLDAALVPNDVHDSRISTTLLWTERVIFVVSPADRSVYNLGDWRKKLGLVCLVNYPRETPMRSLVDKVCSEHALNFKLVHSVNNVDAMKHLVTRQSGYGAFVLRSLVAEELKAKALTEAMLPIELPRSGVSLATRMGEHGNAVAEIVRASLSRNKGRQSK